jgi:hypothetical protein
MKLMINQGKDMLITGGLIMKKRNTVCLAERTVVPTWFEEKPKEKSSALKESGVERGWNQEETGVASKRQA